MPSFHRPFNACLVCQLEFRSLPLGPGISQALRVDIGRVIDRGYPKQCLPEAGALWCGINHYDVT